MTPDGSPPQRRHVALHVVKAVKTQILFQKTSRQHQIHQSSLSTRNIFSLGIRSDSIGVQTI